MIQQKNDFAIMKCNNVIHQGTHGHAHLSRSKRGSKRDGSTSCMHIMADRSREKVRTQQTQEIVVQYAQSCLSAKRFASRQ